MSAEDARTPCVFIVDDEEDVRDAIAMLVTSHGLDVRTFASAAAFLDQLDADQPGCLVLDVRMPGMSGMDLQEWLDQQAIPIPIVFISGHGDIPMAVRAVRQGAVNFLQKPFSDDQLLEWIDTALEEDAARREALARTDAVRQSLDELTPREHDVLVHMLDGKPNKLIARALDVSPRTVEIHRARVLEKMGMDNASQLVRAIMEAELDVKGETDSR